MENGAGFKAKTSSDRIYRMNRIGLDVPFSR